MDLPPLTNGTQILYTPILTELIGQKWINQVTFLNIARAHSPILGTSSTSPETP
jgi:hypothetical protein